MCVHRKLITALLVLAAAVGSLFVYSHLIEMRAKRMVQNTLTLSARITPFPLAVLQQHYGKRLQPEEGCAPSECNYEVMVSNRVLAALHLVPYTELRSSFWVRNGEVIVNELDYATRVDSSRTVTVHAALDFDYGSVFTLHPWSDSTPLDTNGLASISSGSTVTKKQVVFALNTSCLTKLGGCSSVAELLPTVWERTANGAIRCRIPNREGFVDRPSSWTWMK